jgi:hypothetical protein
MHRVAPLTGRPNCAEFCHPLKGAQRASANPKNRGFRDFFEPGSPGFPGIGPAFTPDIHRFSVLILPRTGQARLRVLFPGWNHRRDSQDRIRGP